MSRGPYTIVPHERIGVSYLPRPKQVAITREDARAIVRAEYNALGVIPDVFDHAGRPAQVYTNEEVAKWGLA